MRHQTSAARQIVAWILAICILSAAPSVSLGQNADRVPGDEWMRYTDVAQAGFDAELLEAAQAAWESLPSSAFLVIADGAVVAAWGEVGRRFMCHSE